MGYVVGNDAMRNNPKLYRQPVSVDIGGDVKPHRRCRQCDNPGEDRRLTALSVTAFPLVLPPPPPSNLR